MRIGYACLVLGVQNAKIRSCNLKNADEDMINEIINHNLTSLENIIEYNILNNTKLFRISSDIIPFGSSPVNKIKWHELYESRLRSIGYKINKSGMRVSMHPGQYTVLNSIDMGVVQRAILDVEYHAQFLDALGLDKKHKIILHIGGIYNDKLKAIIRFADNFKILDKKARERIVIENDDKLYNIVDVLKIGQLLNIPVVYDNLHNEINPADEKNDEIYWIDECKKTWAEEDGIQKIHYSQQNRNKKAGSHSESISIDDFMGFYNRLDREDIDIMLEVKDKNLSAIKCINCTYDISIKNLETEWSRYKYKILENSHNNYLKIRDLLKDKDKCNPVLFYQLIEDSLKMKGNTGSMINAAAHVWGYFKHSATDAEKKRYFKYINRLHKGEISIDSVKNLLWRLAVKYNQEYLLNSYYFIL